MNIYDYLNNITKNLTEDDIYNLNMESYDNFKNFIDKHYNLEYMKKNNYLKFVKVTRQKIVLSGVIEYDQYIDKINKIFEEMNDSFLFYRLNFKKYIFNIKKIFYLLKKREISLGKELERFQELYDLFIDKDIKFKLLKTINSCNQKIILFNIKKRKLIYYINKFIELELEYDIDQKLINIVNCERNLIGKKSEFNVNKIISDYVRKLNDKENQIKYYYVKNVDIFKFFNIKFNHDSLCKGEIDGLILRKDNNNYIIEYLIEIKSSLKATFEDIYKIIGLKNFILNYNFESDIFIDNNVYLNKNSFCKLENMPIHKWLIYICNDDKDKIDISHLYFSYCLRIVDYDFIKDYYIDKKDNALLKKHLIITESHEYIKNLLSIWKIHVNLTKNNSCIFIYNK